MPSASLKKLDINTRKSEIDHYKAYNPTQKIRMLTATSLFDGHDASINIMRRLLQERGAEVIHLGHNRTAQDVVKAALEEDVHAIAISSYQGGHMEYFKYIRDLLNEQGGEHIKIFGGGGGVITPREISELEAYGVCKIYSPEDGQMLTLNGIIGHILKNSDYDLLAQKSRAKKSTMYALARSLSELEQNKAAPASKTLEKRFKNIPVIGITGTGGAGKSSLTDELIMRFLWDKPDVKIAVLCIDPSKRKTGGALLGDRIRMNTAGRPEVFVRSFATRGSGSELAKVTKEAVQFLKAHAFDFIIVETSGIGQGDAEILQISDLSLYVMTSEYGASSQLEKIDMLDFANFIVINKFERRQAEDALRDVRTVLRRSRFKGERKADHEYPVFGTIASRYNDDGVNGLYAALAKAINAWCKEERYKIGTQRNYSVCSSNREALIPGQRINYLADISAAVRAYHDSSDQQVALMREIESLELSAELLRKEEQSSQAADKLQAMRDKKWQAIAEQNRQALAEWPKLREDYAKDKFAYQVRNKEVTVQASFTSLSQLKLPKVSLPRFKSRAEILHYILWENLPGRFPFTAGVFPFRRVGEDPQRMFAGEGGPARTNKRFKFLSKDSAAKRLSTAFDSVTLYGANPDKRPDIYGKVGESGVSVATLDDMRELYSGFDLCDPLTSVSKTINGPAPIILAMFLNTAIEQQAEKFVAEQKRQPNEQEFATLRAKTLNSVRGTVQADILKEDQAQNTCIFSTEFALQMMADIQAYFIEHRVKNYYSVSISGYHIAEAGANPITQLAFTLANGFTYVEYYLARGMKIDEFAPNLSFFFSNGIDPEYAVLGRVARRIWAVAMRDFYHASEKSQKLKYHIQTSGRSLHAQEIDFNDVRTTLQALIALYDNCNSLHTNAYDEAITTPTEESVRRALAIQMIINKEFGLNKNENINQGSFFLEELTDLVEEAVLSEFERLASRGGVLGAMETQYQRMKIQEESLYYESLKDSGKLPIIGVNTFLNPKAVANELDRPEIELIRASYAEKDDQLKRLERFKKAHAKTSSGALDNLAMAVVSGKNIFAELMETVRYASLGEICDLLYRVGGQYRRSM